MNKSLIAMFTVAVLSGCSSPQTEQTDKTAPATAEKTQHPSQVYMSSTLPMQPSSKTVLNCLVNRLQTSAFQTL